MRHVNFMKRKICLLQPQKEEVGAMLLRLLLFERTIPYSTVTDLARLRGRSTFLPKIFAVSSAKSWSTGA